MSENFIPLLVASVLFLATHFGLSALPLRNRLLHSLGEKTFLAVYSLIAVVTIAWMVAEYNAAPMQVLWTAPGFLRRAPIVLMPFAFILVVCGVTMRNPTSVGAERLIGAEDSVRGILRVTRHPVMWGITLWAATHLLVNGDTAALIFFGAMLLLAFGGTFAIDHKKRGALGEDWARFARVTSHLPFAAILAGRNHFAPGEIGLWRIALALAAYGAFLAAHRALFGAVPY
jgi:uncharacterized membrane protein